MSSWRFSSCTVAAPLERDRVFILFFDFKSLVCWRGGCWRFAHYWQFLRRVTKYSKSKSKMKTPSRSRGAAACGNYSISTILWTIARVITSHTTLIPYLPFYISVLPRCLSPWPLFSLNTIAVDASRRDSRRISLNAGTIGEYPCHSCDVIVFRKADHLSNQLLPPKPDPFPLHSLLLHLNLSGFSNPLNPYPLSLPVPLLNSRPTPFLIFFTLYTWILYLLCVCRLRRF